MADTSKSPTYLLVQERVGRDTIEFLRARRDAGESWRQISLGLWADHELDVTEVTLRKWWHDAEAGEAAAPVPQ